MASNKMAAVENTFGQNETNKEEAAAPAGTLEHSTKTPFQRLKEFWEELTKDDGEREVIETIEYSRL